MAVVVGLIRLLVPMTHFLILLSATLVGAAVYFAILFRLDKEICREVGSYAENFWYTLAVLQG